MLYEKVNIDAMVHEFPEEKISSEELEMKLKPVYDRLRLRVGRLELMTGIKERRFWPVGFMPSDGAALAGEKALNASGISRDKIGCLLMCSVSRDFLEPATATVVHHKLKLPENSLVFDISNACLGVLTGMTVLANMIELGQVEAGLVVAGENSRPLVETTVRKILEDESIDRNSIKPYFASLTIGSGAAAVVMSRRGLGNADHRLLGGVSLAATEHNDLCRGNADRGMNDGADIMMSTDSETLMLEGVRAARNTWSGLKNTLGKENEDFDCICTHQVGSAHKKLLIEELGLNADKDFSSLENYGNVGSVSCPATAAMAIESGALKEGELLALLGIGSGINCSMLGVEW
jgi:3-oxoacyl-[acyl-carrier-protein] synthase-3